MVSERRVAVEIDARVSPFVRGLSEAAAATKGFAQELETADSRFSTLIQTGLALAPALVPLGAVAVPAVAGLTAQLGLAAGAAGVAALAFSGIGDALDAVNKYHLQPTQANLDKMRLALEHVGPAGAEFVHFIEGLKPDLQGLQEIAREGLFPGLEQGLTRATVMLPQVQQLIATISSTLGHLAARAGAGLGSPEWLKFFDYLQAVARPILVDMGETFAHFAGAARNLFEAFAPMAMHFSDSLVKMSAAVEKWSAGLGQSQGFEAFVRYVRESGPLVGSALKAIGEALVAVVEAAAPIGHVVLPVITGLAHALTAVMQSPAGPILLAIASGMSAVSLAMKAYEAANGFALVKMLKGTAQEGEAAAGGLSAFAVKAGVAVAAVMAIHDAFHTSASEMQRFFDMIHSRAGGSATHELDMLTAAMKRQQAIAKSAMWDVNIPWLNTHIFSNNAAADADSKAKAIKDRIAEIQQQRRMDAMASQQEAASVNLVSDALNRNTDSLLESYAAMKENRQEVLAAQNARIAYQAAIDDASAALKQNGKTLDIHTAKGRANKQALLNLAAAWNAESDAAKNAPGAHRQAIKTFVDLAEKMGMDADKAKALAKRIYEIPGNKGIKVTADVAQAMREIEAIDSKVIHDKSFKVTAIYGTAGSTYNERPAIGGGRYDAGGYTGPGARLEPAGIVHRDEVVLPQWIVHRDASLLRSRYGFLPGMSDLPGYARGGLVGAAPTYTASDQLNILQLEQQIHQLLRDLAKTGKDRVDGLQRRIDEVQVTQLRQELRQARRQPLVDQRQALVDQVTALRGIGGLDVSSALGLQPRNPIAAAVRDQIASFRASVKQAGGEWTKQMQRTTQRMLEHARAIDADNRALTRQQTRLDRLNTHLDDLNSRMQNLQQTMADYGSQVGGNFLTSPFGLSLSGGTGGTVAPMPDPAYAGTQAALSDAEQRLAAIRASGGDPLQRSYAASKVVAEIGNLQSQLGQLQSGTTGVAAATDQAVTGLDAFKQTLLDDTKHATDFLAALKKLGSEGLDPGLFAQLASSGDLTTATQLAALSPADLSQIDRLWQARATAAAQVAAYATQQVYGQQQAQLQVQIDHQNRLIAATQSSINHLDRQVANLGQRVEHGAERGVASLKGEIAGLRKDVQNQAHQIAQIHRGGKGRG